MPGGHSIRRGGGGLHVPLSGGGQFISPATSRKHRASGGAVAATMTTLASTVAIAASTANSGGGSKLSADGGGTRMVRVAPDLFSQPVTTTTTNDAASVRGIRGATALAYSSQMTGGADSCLFSTAKASSSRTKNKVEARDEQRVFASHVHHERRMDERVCFVIRIAREIELSRKVRNAFVP